MSTDDIKMEEARVVLIRTTKRRLSTTSEDSKTDVVDTPTAVRRSTRRLSTTSEDTKAEEAPKSVRRNTRRLSTASEDPILEETPSSIRKSTRRLSADIKDPIVEDVPSNIRKSTRRLSTAAEDPIAEEVPSSLRRSSRSTSVLQRNVLEEKPATPKRRVTRRNSDVSDPGTVSSPSVASRQLRSRKNFSDNEDSVQTSSTPIKRRESRRLTNIIHEDENTLQTIEEKENIENHSLISKSLEVIKENLRKSFSNMENEIDDNLESNARTEPSTSPKQKSIDDKTIEDDNSKLSTGVMEPKKSEEIKDDKSESNITPKKELDRVTRSNTPKNKVLDGNNAPTTSHTHTVDKNDEKTSHLSKNENHDIETKIQEKSESSPLKERIMLVESPKKATTLDEKLNDSSGSPKKQNISKTPPKGINEHTVDGSPIIGSGRKTRLSISKLSYEADEISKKETVPEENQSSFRENPKIKNSPQKEIDRETQPSTPTVDEENKFEVSPTVTSIRKSRSSIVMLNTEDNTTDITKKETIGEKVCSPKEEDPKIKNSPQKEIDRKRQLNTPTRNDKQKDGTSPKIESDRKTRSSISRPNSEEEIVDTPKNKSVQEKSNSFTINEDLKSEDNPQNGAGSPKHEGGRKTRSSFSSQNDKVQSNSSSIIDYQKIGYFPRKEFGLNSQSSTPTRNEEQDVVNSPKIESGRKTRSSISKQNNEENADTPKKETFQEQFNSSTDKDDHKVGLDTPQKEIGFKIQSNKFTVNEEQKIESDLKTRSSISKSNGEEEIAYSLENETSNTSIVNEKQTVDDSPKIESARLSRSSISKFNEVETIDISKTKLSNLSIDNDDKKIEDISENVFGLRTRPNTPAANEEQKIETMDPSKKETLKEDQSFTINEDQQIKETLQKEIEQSIFESGRKTRSSISKYNTEEEQSSDTSKKETVKSEAKNTIQKQILKVLASTPTVNEEQETGDNPKKEGDPKYQSRSLIDSPQKESGSITQSTTPKAIKELEAEVVESGSPKAIDRKTRLSTLAAEKELATSDTPTREKSLLVNEKSNVDEILTNDMSVENISINISVSKNTPQKDLIKEEFESTLIKRSARRTRLSTLAANKEQDGIDTPTKGTPSKVNEVLEIVDTSTKEISVKSKDISLSDSVATKERDLSPILEQKRSRKNDSPISSTSKLIEQNENESFEDEKPNLSKNVLSPIKNVKSSNRNSPKLDTPKSKTMELRKKQNNSILNFVSSTPTALKGHAETHSDDSTDSTNNFTLKMSPEKSTDHSSPSSKAISETSKKENEKNDCNLNVSDNVLELRKRSIIKSSPQTTPEKKNVENILENEESLEESAKFLKSFVNLPQNSDVGKDNQKIADDSVENKQINQSLGKSKNSEEKATDAADESTDVEESNENHSKYKKKLKKSSNKNKKMENSKLKNSDESESTDDEDNYKNHKENDNSKNVWNKKCELAVQSGLPDSDDSSELSGYSDNNSSKKSKRKPQVSETSDSENDDKNEFIDNEAVECNDSRTPSPDENEIIEVGESIESDFTDEDEESEDDYEKDSFVVSDELGDEADLLSGTGDDLSDGSKSDDSEILLSQSKASKQAFNKKAYKKSRIIRESDESSDDSISFKETSMKVVCDDQITSSNEIVEIPVENQLENNKDQENQQDREKTVDNEENNSSSESLEESSIEKLENSLNEINKLHSIIENISEVITENISKKKRRSSLSLSKITNEISEALNESSSPKKPKLNDTSELIPETNNESVQKLDKSLNSSVNAANTSKAFSKKDKSLNSSVNAANTSKALSKRDKSLNSPAVSDSTSETISPKRKLKNSINSSVISENISEAITKVETSPNKKSKSLSSLEISETIKTIDISPKKKNKSLNSSSISNEIPETSQGTNISPSKKLGKKNQSSSIFYDDAFETNEETDVISNKKLNKSLENVHEDANENNVSKKKLKNKQLNKSKISQADVDIISADSSEIISKKKKKQNKSNINESVDTISAVSSEDGDKKEEKLKNKELNKSNISKEDLDVTSGGSLEVSSKKKKKLKNKLNKLNTSENCNVISVGTSEVYNKKEEKLKNNEIKHDEDYNAIPAGPSGEASSKKKKITKEKKKSIVEDKNIEKKIPKTSSSSSEVDEHVKGKVPKKIEKSKLKLKEKLESNKKWLDENFVALNVQLPNLLNTSFETSKKHEETSHKVKKNSEKRKIYTNNQFEPTKKKSKNSSFEGFEVISLGQKITPSKLGTTELNFKSQRLFGSNVPRQSSLDLINKNSKAAVINRRK